MAKKMKTIQNYGWTGAWLSPTCIVGICLLLLLGGIFSAGPDDGKPESQVIHPDRLEILVKSNLQESVGSSHQARFSLEVSPDWVVYGVVTGTFVQPQSIRKSEHGGDPNCLLLEFDRESIKALNEDRRLAKVFWHKYGVGSPQLVEFSMPLPPLSMLEKETFISGPLREISFNLTPEEIALSENSKCVVFSSDGHMTARLQDKETNGLSMVVLGSPPYVVLWQERTVNVQDRASPNPGPTFKVLLRKVLE